MSAFDTLNRSGLSMLADLPRITTPIAQLNPSLWPDCPLCDRDVNSCDCDPHDYEAAVRERLA